LLKKKDESNTIPNKEKVIVNRIDEVVNRIDESNTIPNDENIIKCYNDILSKTLTFFEYKTPNIISKLSKNIPFFEYEKPDVPVSIGLVQINDDTKFWTNFLNNKNNNCEIQNPGGGARNKSKKQLKKSKKSKNQKKTKKNKFIKKKNKKRTKKTTK